MIDDKKLEDTPSLAYVPDIPDIDPDIGTSEGYSLSIKSPFESKIYVGQTITYSVNLYKDGILQTKLPSGAYLDWIDDSVWLGATQNFSYTWTPTTIKTHTLRINIIRSGEILATTSVQIQVVDINLSYYIDNNIALTDLVKSNDIIKSSTWMHTLAEASDGYPDFKPLNDYGIAVGDLSTEPPHWYEESIHTNYYFKYKDKDTEIKFLPKSLISSFLHNLNEEWEIEDYYDLRDYSLSAVVDNRYEGRCYYKLEVSEDFKTLSLTKYDENGNKLDIKTKNASDFEYNKIPSIIYLAGCGGGAAGTPRLVVGEDLENFVPAYFGKSYVTSFAVGGGSGSSILVGLMLSKSNRVVYLKVGLGGRAAGDSNTLNLNRCGEPTIISTTLQGLSHFKDLNSEVLVLEGGIQMEDLNWPSYKNRCRTKDDFYSFCMEQSQFQRDPTIAYYYQGNETTATSSYNDIYKSIKDNSSIFYPVPLEESASIYSGKYGPIIAWGQGYGAINQFTINPSQGSSNNYPPIPIWTKTNEYSIVPTDSWSLPGEGIEGTYKITPNEISETKYMGPYFSGAFEQEVTVGGAPSCFGDGGGYPYYGELYWPSDDGLNPVDFRRAYNSGGDSVRVKIDKVTYPTSPGYGAGGPGIDSNFDRDDNKYGGNGCIFLYY